VVRKVEVKRVGQGGGGDMDDWLDYGGEGVVWKGAGGDRNKNSRRKKYRAANGPGQRLWEKKGIWQELQIVQRSLRRLS